jgi:AhpD family alkylhydroperoxidase
MTPRLNPYKAAPDAVKAQLALSDYVKNCGLEPALQELIKIRASQLNGCAYCLHMHTRDARAAGESEERIYLLDAWRESPLYSARERAALAWTEAVTLVAEDHVPDEVYEAARKEFSEEELVKLTLAIGMINTWNRISIAFRSIHPVSARKSAQAAE